MAVDTNIVGFYFSIQVQQTDQPYVFTNDDPLNAEDPLGEDPALLGNPSQYPDQTAPGGSTFRVTSSGAGIITTGVGSIYVQGAGDGESFEIPYHALQRLLERDVSTDEIEDVLSQPSFRYIFEGEWRTGFYDESSQIFVGSVDGRITTVMTDVEPDYVDDLIFNSIPDLDNFGANASQFFDDIVSVDEDFGEFF
jgi:hypothetical protein